MERKQQTPNQPADVTFGTIQSKPSEEKKEQDASDAEGCPAHPGKLNHTENDLLNPIDGKKAQDQLFECKSQEDETSK